MNEDAVTSRAALGVDPSDMTEKSEIEAITGALNRASPNSRPMTHDISVDPSARYGPNYDQKPIGNTRSYKGGSLIASAITTLVPILLPIISKGIKKLLRGEPDQTKLATKGVGLGRGLGRGKVPQEDQFRIIRAIHKMSEVLESALEDDITSGHIDSGAGLARSVVKSAKQIGREFDRILGPQAHKILGEAAKSHFIGAGLTKANLKKKRSGGEHRLTTGRLIYPFMLNALSKLRRHIRSTLGSGTSLEDFVEIALEEDPEMDNQLSYADIVSGRGFWDNLKKWATRGFEAAKNSKTLRKMLDVGWEGVEGAINEAVANLNTRLENAEGSGKTLGRHADKKMMLTKISKKTQQKLVGKPIYDLSESDEDDYDEPDDFDEPVGRGIRRRPLGRPRVSKKKMKARTPRKYM